MESIDLRTVAKINSHEVSKILRYSRFLCNCKCDILKNFYLVLNTGLIPFSNRKYKGRKKLATKKKQNKKNNNPGSANINSREVLKIIVNSVRKEFLKFSFQRGH